MGKLLFYLDRRARGGAQRVMIELAGFFAGHGPDGSGEACNVILACQLEAPDRAYPLADGVREVILPPSSKNRLKRQADRIHALTELCKKERPDIIISFLAGTNIIAIKTGRKLGIPVLISVRNDPARDGSRLSRYLVKRCYPQASGCVFQTEQARDYFGFKYPTAVIMNPLSAEILAGIEAQAPAEAKDPAGASGPAEMQAPAEVNSPTGMRFISVGRLEPQKRHDVTLRAFAGLHESYPGASLRIFGQGPLREELLRLAESLGVAEAVELAGVSGDIAAELRASEVFVMSSDYEGMPNALMEAMAAGLACISTDCPCGGPSSIIKDGENGWLFPVGDAESLREKMVYITQHPEQAKAAGVRASEIRQTCRIENIAPQWGRIIAECQRKSC